MVSLVDTSFGDDFWEQGGLVGEVIKCLLVHGIIISGFANHRSIRGTKRLLRSVWLCPQRIEHFWHRWILVCSRIQIRIHRAIWRKRYISCYFDHDCFGFSNVMLINGTELSDCLKSMTLDSAFDSWPIGVDCGISGVAFHQLTIAVFCYEIFWHGQFVGTDSINACPPVEFTCLKRRRRHRRWTVLSLETKIRVARRI